ncbi:hypothetical protein OsI_12675 [Oryza sativa Indica Group]|uniref:Uncharacterized protein n=2 Tax=Oryza sativa TaxID=4530 RepID=A2XJQ6_ORYSI|nr:hypothetical protein OsI_12675 [Oryza sativa Indica Group]
MGRKDSRSRSGNAKRGPHLTLDRLPQDVLHQIIALLPVPHENFYGPGDIILSSNSVPKHYPWMDNTIVYKVKWIHISRGLILLCKTTLVVG